MCDVVTALTIASSAFSYMQQSQAADAQQDAIEAAYNAQTQQLADRYEQINQNSTDQVSERTREARAELARIRVAGAESGLGGVSQQRIEGESEMLRGTDIASIEGNRKNALKAAQYGGQSAQLEGNARMAAVRRPSLVGTGLQIAGAGISAYDKEQVRKRGAA
jgi:ribosomal protein L29